MVLPSSPGRVYIDPDLPRLMDALREHGAQEARVAFVLGSGLGAFADAFEAARAVPYADLVGMPTSSVPGHAGRLVLGRLSGVSVLALQGRAHLYEGWSVREATRAVRALAGLGVGTFLLTNAAGGLVPEWGVPGLMAIVDHVNLQGRAPLAGSERGTGTPYDAALVEILAAAARGAGVELQRGVYAGLMGPTYETPAEVRMLRRFGAHAVGMSTVQEALAAHASGARVAAVSCITNLAAGITGEKLDHAEVVEAGRQAAASFQALLVAATPGFAASAQPPPGPAPEPERGPPAR
jgi:purine-nucleoside phosphorylase